MLWMCWYFDLFYCQIVFIGPTAKCCKDIAETFYILHTLFLLLSTSYVSMVHLLQLMKVHCYNSVIQISHLRSRSYIHLEEFFCMGDCSPPLFVCLFVY